MAVWCVAASYSTVPYVHTHTQQRHTVKPNNEVGRERDESDFAKREREIRSEKRIRVQHQKVLHTVRKLAEKFEES